MLFSSFGIFLEGFRRPFGEVHSSCFGVVAEPVGCRFCISRSFLLSSFFGHVGLKHRFHGRLPASRTNSSGQPHALQAFPVGFTMPLWGSGNEVWQVFWK